MIAINSEIPHTEIVTATVAEVTSIYIRPIKLLVLCYYRPPLVNDFEPLLSYLKNVSGQYPGSDMLLVGDFNLPSIDWTDPHKTSKPLNRSFLDMLSQFHLTQSVTEPTHIKGNTLDLVCSNLENKLFAIDVEKPGLSDHFMITFSIDYTTSIAPSKPQPKFRDYCKADVSRFCDMMYKLKYAIEESIDNGADINHVWNHFKTGLHQAVDDCVPTKKSRFRPPHEPYWFNKAAKKACAKQKRLYDNYKKTGDYNYYAKYKVLRKDNKKLFKILKREYLDNKLFEPFNSGDTKPFFHHLRNLKRNSSTIHSLETNNGDLTQDRKCIADNLNQYFKSVFTDKSDSSGIPTSDDPAIVCTREGIYKLIIGLKTGKAPGPDNITKEILCIAPSPCADILTDIFNLSLSSGKLPDDWKKAIVSPIFKQGSRTKPSNYRPISLTCICCKMLEHVILHHLNQLFDDLLHPNQHGFRRHRSCTTQLITVVHDITAAIDSGEQTHAALLDFSKAFDVVSHQILITKLTDINLDCSLVAWITDFLTGRTQKVVIDGVYSDEVPVTSGVPQGSVLGPALFLLYINDIVDCVDHCSIRLFADDTIVYMPVKNERDALCFQRDLDNLFDWSVQNKMKFNTSKSNIIIFGKQPNIFIEYRINGEIIPHSDTVKYLGLYIHRSLKWEHHIESILSRSRRTLALLTHTLYNATPRLKKVAYYSICRPVLEYGSELWDPTHKTTIQSLEVLQNKAVRFIFRIKGRDTSMTEIKNHNHINTLQQRRKNKRLITLLHILEFDYLFPTLKCTIDRMLSNKPTRSSSQSQLLPLRCNTNLFLNSFIQRTSREIRKADVEAGE